MKRDGSSKDPAKSLYELYHELLYLREEVREAEQRSAEGPQRSPRPGRTIDEDV